MTGRAKRTVRSIEALEKMGVQVVSTRGEDGRMHSRLVMSCHSCDRTLEFSNSKTIAPDHLAHMASDKGWTFGKRGGTCDHCRSKTKAADVPNLRYVPETTYGAQPAGVDLSGAISMASALARASAEFRRRYSPMIPTPLPGYVVERAEMLMDAPPEPLPQHRCIIHPGFPKTLGEATAEWDAMVASRPAGEVVQTDLEFPRGLTKTTPEEARAFGHKAMADAFFSKPRWGRSNDPAFHAEIRPLIEQGQTDADIAAAVGCTHDMIRQARLAMGLPNYRTIRDQRKGKTDMGEVRAMTTPPQAATAPIIPSIRETVAISEKLDAHFNEAAGCYNPPCTDQKIGEALSLPAAKVAAVRAGLGLVIKGNPELHAIREELGAVEKMVAELRQRLERAERKAAEGNIR